MRSEAVPHCAGGCSEHFVGIAPPGDVLATALLRGRRGRSYGLEGFLCNCSLCVLGHY